MTNQYENLIIIGAGMSFKHSRCTDENPPLGLGLYNRLISLYGKIVDTNKYKYDNDDFEKWMSSLSTDGEAYMDVLLYMSKFFKRFDKVPNDSNYYKLIFNLKNNNLLLNTAFISINYDALLELAIINSNYGINYGSTKIVNQLNFNNEKCILIYKPHGSCNFGPPKEICNMFSGVGNPFSGTENSEIEYPVVIATHPKDIYWTNNNFPSCICAYTQNKTATLSTKIIEDIRNNVSTKLSTLKRIIIIGVGYPKQEEYITQILRIIFNNDQKIKFAYIGDDESYKKFEKLSPNNINFEHISKKFDNESSIEIANFLKN